MSESNFADKTSKVTVMLDGQEKILTVQDLIDIAEFYRPAVFWYIKEIPINFTGIAKIIVDDVTAYIKDGKYHRNNGPAFISNENSKVYRWYYNGTCYGHNDDFTVESWIRFLDNGLQLNFND